MFLEPDTSAQVAYSCLFAFIRYAIQLQSLHRSIARAKYINDDELMDGLAVDIMY